jgi:isopropanol dehydrogenase (NADP+)
LIENGRVDPTLMTTHRFTFDEVDKAFQLMDTKDDGILKPLILFE